MMLSSHINFFIGLILSYITSIFFLTSSSSSISCILSRYLSILSPPTFDSCTCTSLMLDVMLGMESNFFASIIADMLLYCFMYLMTSFFSSLDIVRFKLDRQRFTPSHFQSTILNMFLLCLNLPHHFYEDSD